MKVKTMYIASCVLPSWQQHTTTPQIYTITLNVITNCNVRKLWRPRKHQLEIHNNGSGSILFFVAFSFAGHLSAINIHFEKRKKKRIHTRTRTKFTWTSVRATEVFLCKLSYRKSLHTLTDGCLNVFGLFICVVMRGFNQWCQAFEAFLWVCATPPPPTLICTHTHNSVIYVKH